jgi:acetone carboxylase gamma subunit
MKLRETESITRVPGTPQTQTTRLREWVCPECDYFEEVENGEN